MICPSPPFFFTTIRGRLSVLFPTFSLSSSASLHTSRSDIYQCLSRFPFLILRIGMNNGQACSVRSDASTRLAAPEPRNARCPSLLTPIALRLPSLPPRLHPFPARHSILSTLSQKPVSTSFRSLHPSRPSPTPDRWRRPSLSRSQRPAPSPSPRSFSIQPQATLRTSLMRMPLGPVSGRSSRMSGGRLTASATLWPLFT